MEFIQMLLVFSSCLFVFSSKEGVGMSNASAGNTGQCFLLLGMRNNIGFIGSSPIAT